MTGASEVNPLPFIVLVDSDGAEPLKPERKITYYIKWLQVDFCKKASMKSVSEVQIRYLNN